MNDRRSATERFYDACIPEPNSGCWLWLMGLSQDGYGKFKVSYKTVPAHRFSYEIHKGKPGDSLVLHRCDIKCCVNPDHLWLGTPNENSKDMVAKDRQAKHEKNGRAKLTKEIVEIIRADQSSKHKELAARYGVTRGLISCIKRGEFWK